MFKRNASAKWKSSGVHVDGMHAIILSSIRDFYRGKQLRFAKHNSSLSILNQVSCDLRTCERENSFGIRWCNNSKDVLVTIYDQTQTVRKLSEIHWFIESLIHIVMTCWIFCIKRLIFWKKKLFIIFSKIIKKIYNNIDHVDIILFTYSR